MYQGKYDHLVVIDEKKNSLSIYRFFENGEKDLLTSARLPEINALEDYDAFVEIAKEIGINILSDSPEARKMLKL